MYAKRFNKEERKTEMTRVERTEQFLKESFQNSTYFAVHRSEMDYRLEHSYRVANIAKKIAQEEGMDVEGMVIAGLLHDVAYCEEFQGEDGWLNHGRKSAQIARPFLVDMGLPNELVQEICYGIAIHVDDNADFPGEKTAFAETVGDADNIDRFDAYRIYEGLQYTKFSELSLEEKTEKVNETLAKLEKYEHLELGTKTATEMWKEKIVFQKEFYQRLRGQMSNSKFINK